MLRLSMKNIFSNIKLEETNTISGIVRLIEGSKKTNVLLFDKIKFVIVYALFFTKSQKYLLIFINIR